LKNPVVWKGCIAEENLMPVIVLLMLAIALPADLRVQPVRAGVLPELPQLNTRNFLPAIRQQIQQAYAAAEAKPLNSEASGKLGMVLDAYEQYESAALCYRRAHLLDPGSFRWLFYLGRVQAILGQHQDAVLTLREALRRTPGDVTAQLTLADSLLALGKWEEGSAIYQVISNAHPDSAEAYYGLGRVHAARGNLTAAATAYLKACELFSPYGPAHYALAMVYRKLGQRTESQQQFNLYEENKDAVPPLTDPLRSAIVKLNLGPIAHIRRAAALEQAGKFAEAIAEEHEALRVDPDAVQAHIQLIALYGRLAQYDQAADHYRAALELDRNQADAYYNYGVVLLKQTKPQDAEKAFQQALEINPYYAEAHNNLGSLYEQQGRLDEALRQFGEAVQNRPNYPLAHFHIGRILTNQGRYDEAIRHFLKSLTPEDENTPRYLYALAGTYARAGDLPAALRYARTARVQAAARGQAQLLTSIDRDIQALEKAVANIKQP
jgi:tetratricopeptide (TPR) repeat protein